MKKQYKIMYRYNGKVEEIDCTESKTEAEYMLSEYRLAFGKSGNIWVKESCDKE